MRAPRLFLLALSSLLLAAGTGCQSLGAKDISYKPDIHPANFQTMVDNPFFPLVPGTVWTYIEKDRDGAVEKKVEVTHDTKNIMGVTCVVVHDVVRKNGRIAEDTHNWYAQDRNGNVWYFGNAAKEISAGGQIETTGSFEAGVKGAQPGIVMPGDAKPGKEYRQEYAVGEAEDMGQIVAVGESVAVPFGTYKDTVKTKDYSLLEAGNDYKWYARGIGFVRSESTAGATAELISMLRK